MEAYCVKCKTQREMRDTQEVTNPETGRTMAKGACTICGTKMNKFLPKAKVA